MYSTCGPRRSGPPGRPDDSDCRLGLSRKPVRYRHVWPGFLLLAALALLLVGLLRWGDHFLSPGPTGRHPSVAAALGGVRAPRRSPSPRPQPRRPRRSWTRRPVRRHGHGAIRDRSGAARAFRTGVPAAPVAPRRFRPPRSVRPPPVASTPVAPRPRSGRQDAGPGARGGSRARPPPRRPLRRRFATRSPSAPSPCRRTPSAWRPSSTRLASRPYASACRRRPSSSRCRCPP